MIRALMLHNWRNYDDITVTFGEGTTFVVASNGVGKTSLVEAARWALYGVKGPGGNAVRNGRNEAHVRVDLELPDGRLLGVERTLPAKGRKTEPTPRVILDGRELPHDHLGTLFREVYGAESWFLAGVTMPAADRINDKPSALRLREHLGQYYGIDSLSDALSRLKVLHKECEAQIKAIKQSHAEDANAVEDLRFRKQEADQKAENSRALHEALQKRLEAARDRAIANSALESWGKAQGLWSASIDRLSTEMAILIGRKVPSLAFEDVLTQSLDAAGSLIEQVRIQIALTEAKMGQLRANDERLGEGHEDCPVCRRPLDDSTIGIAHEANVHDLVVLEGQLAELRNDQSKALSGRESLQQIREQWRSIPRPGPKPPGPADTDEQLSLDELRLLAEEALAEQVNARADSVAAARKYEEAVEANEAMSRLEALFRRLAKLEVAIAATDRTLQEMLDSNVQPLMTEVRQRWASLFPNRGQLDTSSDGEVSRAVNGEPLPFNSFSTGEAMVVNLVIRLLVTQMASEADFCWFDEPLEHLDPDIRRKVASLLTRVTSGGRPFRQIVVTTYEEPLARHLKIRDETWVTLLDVRETVGEADLFAG